MRSRRRRVGESSRGLIAFGVVVVVLVLVLVFHGRSLRIRAGMLIVVVRCSMVVSLRWMVVIVIAGFAAVALDYVIGGKSEALVSVGGVLALTAVSVVALLGAYRREATGLGGVSAESVIAELREQLLVQGQVPKLPAGWHVDVEQRAAHNAAMAGDFVSGRMHDVGGNLHLDLVLVDVSGKGVEAGTRALLLSGAMGGLLGAVGPDEFLIEANYYLRRQSWAEGFASAVYVRVNLETGLYSVRSAGHLPALHMDANAGAWRMSDSKGQLLGILPQVTVRADYKTMRPGDALLLYTDGVVEDPSRDLAWGTDRLMGAAETIVRRGAMDKVARRLVDEVPTRLDDDRAVVMIWRDPR